MTHGGPKLAAEEQARDRIKEQSPGEEKNQEIRHECDYPGG